MRIALVLMTSVFQVLGKGLISSPKNVVCIGKMKSKDLKYSSSWPRIKCTWDHDQYTTDIKYRVHLKQNEEHICESSEKNCSFPDDVIVLMHDTLKISVSAEDAYGNSALSNEVSYSEGWDIVQMDSPTDIIAKPLPSGLRVSWKIEWSNVGSVECEIQLHEKGSKTKPVVKNPEDCFLTALEITEVKPCTNYSVSMRSRFQGSVWSTWSPHVTTTSYLNVSGLQFWRSKSILSDRGTRTVHLMWKGVPPSCKAFDKYCIFNDSQRIPECFGPFQDHTFITLDEHSHRITVAMVLNGTSLKEASIEVPAMAREVNLPPVGNVNVVVQHGRIQITWNKPSLPVSGYIIVWNSTSKNHMWQQTLETNFTLKGEPFALYTISLTPLYKDGPGNEITLHNCNQEGNINKVSKVEVTRVSDTYAEIHWLPLLPTHCCAFVLNYMVFYKTYNESKPKNVPVRANEHYVILRNLQPGTEYSVYIMANTLTATSKSVPITFLTNPNSNSLFIVTILLLSCCVLLILLSMIVLTIQKKLLNKKIPDPRFSSLSMWPSENCKKAWRLLPVSGGRDTEKILPCHVDSEVISVSPTSKKDMATVKALTDIQNNATPDPASQTENTPVASSFTNEDLLPFGGREQRVPLKLQSSEMCLVPSIQSPYRKQTPVNSPVESLGKPVWLDETETLLTPKQKNSNDFASYVTLDMFDSKKHPNK
ncbi:interleukin-31 receptor subunit alpha-like [Clarias gariepinus]